MKRFRRTVLATALLGTLALNLIFFAQTTSRPFPPNTNFKCSSLVILYCFFFLFFFVRKLCDYVQI